MRHMPFPSQRSFSSDTPMPKGICNHLQSLMSHKYGKKHVFTNKNRIISQFCILETASDYLAHAKIWAYLLVPLNARDAIASSSNHWPVDNLLSVQESTAS